MPFPSPRRDDTLDWLLQVAYTTLRLFTRNSLSNHAAATAFYFMLSVTPLLLLLAYAAQWLAWLAESSVPAAILLAALYDQFHLDSLTGMGFIPERARLAAGGVGLLTLLLSSRGLLNAVQGAFKVIFPEEGKGRLVVSWLMPLVILPITLLLAGLAVVAQAALTFLANIELLGAAGAGLLKALNLGLALLLVWGLVFTAYWRLPRPHPPVRLTALVALLSSLTLLGLFAGFGLFFKVESYRAVYGALGGVVFVLIAAYFASTAFYLWAQALYALAKVDVAALERLFLGPGADQGRLESYVFGRAHRLLEKYGQTYSPGVVLIREGDAGREAYFLYSGQVGLYRGEHERRRKLGSLAAGELFGEMAYLLDEPRTATVEAETEVVALVLPPHLLEELMRYSAPLSRRIIAALSQRLLRMNRAGENQQN